MGTKPMRQTLRRCALALSATLIAGPALAAGAPESATATPPQKRFERIVADQRSGGDYAHRGANGRLGAYALLPQTLQVLGVARLQGWDGLAPLADDNLVWSAAAREAGIDSIDSFLAHADYQDGLFARQMETAWQAIDAAGLTTQCQTGFDALGHQLSDSVCLGYAALLGTETTVEYLYHNTLPGDSALWQGGRSAVTAKLDAAAKAPQDIAPQGVPMASAPHGGRFDLAEGLRHPRGTGGFSRVSATAPAAAAPAATPTVDTDRFGVYGLDVSQFTDRPLVLANAGTAASVGGPGAGSGLNGIGTGAIGIVPVQNGQTGTAAGTGSTTAASGDSMSQPGCTDETWTALTETSTQAVEDSIGRRQNQTAGPTSVLEGSCFDFRDFTDVGNVSVLFDPTSFLQGLIQGLEERACNEFNSAFNSVMGAGFSGNNFFTPFGSSVPSFGGRGVLGQLLGGGNSTIDLGDLLRSGSGSTRNVPSQITAIPVLTVTNTGR